MTLDERTRKWQRITRRVMVVRPEGMDWALMAVAAALTASGEDFDTACKLAYLHPKERKWLLEERE